MISAGMRLLEELGKDYHLMAEGLPDGRRVVVSVGTTAPPHPSSSARLMMLPAMPVAKPQR